MLFYFSSRIHDVGGQHSDRRKWLNLFDCVHAVTFCVALTSYDMMTTTSVIGSGPPSSVTARKAGGPNSCPSSMNVKTNHMRESLKLFSAISNSKVFFDATMILFLSKTDIFRVRSNFKLFDTNFVGNWCIYFYFLFFNVIDFWWSYITIFLW